MHRTCANIYKTARAGSGLTQEAAAERLGISVESMRAYETGGRMPPGEMVALMAEIYGSPGLRLEHAAATDTLGIIPEGVRPRTLEQAALRLFNAVRALLDRGPRLAEIAEDGCVDATEAQDFERIEDLIGSVVAAALEARCCTKKEERPKLAGSKRSCGQAFGEAFDHESILAQSPEMSRKTAAGKAVDFT